MKVLLLVLTFFSAIGQEKQYDVVSRSLFAVSNGISLLVCEKNIQHSQEIINGITNLASLIAEEQNLTLQDVADIQQILLSFEEQIKTYTATKSLFKASDAQRLLAEGLSQLIYHVFVLSVFRKDLALHIRNIISALLKVIVAMIDDKSEDHQDLIQVNALLQEAVNKKILCHACLKN